MFRLILAISLALFAPSIPPDECITDSCVGCLDDCGATLED